MRGSVPGNKLKRVMVPGTSSVPSAARRLQAFEVQQLADTARALPAGWVVAVEAPHGQLALLPRDGLHRQSLTWVADGEASKCYRQRWIEGTLRWSPSSVRGTV
jgi:hypothetical protein